MYAEEKQSINYGKWWLSVGCLGLLTTVSFVALTLYIGGAREERVRGPRPSVAAGPRHKAVIEMVSLDEARKNRVSIPLEKEEGRYEEDFRVPRGDSEPLDTRQSLEEIFSNQADKEGATKKKSEAIFPWVDPDSLGKPGFSLTELSNYYEEPISSLERRLRDSEASEKKNSSILISKLKEIYSEPDTPVSSLIYPPSGNSSLVSFGLLAIDLLLLHNVQEMAWAEEEELGQKMQRDPEVAALKALFLSPQELKGGRTVSEEDGGLLQEAAHFLSGSYRALFNLAKAYRNSASSSTPRSSSSPSSLECLWTLYCRNLDKTAKLPGPYGFLAKLNSLGLRLIMGEFPLERALDKLISEATSGWSSLNCPALFPRCTAEEAQSVALATALEENQV